MPGLIILIILFIYVFLTFPRLNKRQEFIEFKKHVYAHRGFHDNNQQIPENSMAAFNRAIERGYGIELDVQLTKDGQLVVFHDFNLKRVCGVNIEVDACDYQELLSYTLFSTSQHIPLFSEVLALVNGQVPLIVEIKQKSINSLTAKKTATLLDQYHGQYCIESFNPMALYWFRKHRSHVIRGQLSSKFNKEDTNPFLGFCLQRLMLNCLSRPDFIAYHHHYLNNISVQIQKAIYCLPIVAWTVDDQQTYKKLQPKYTIIFEKFTI